MESLYMHIHILLYLRLVLLSGSWILERDGNTMSLFGLGSRYLLAYYSIFHSTFFMFSLNRVFLFHVSFGTCISSLSVTTMLCDWVTVRRQYQILIEEKHHGFCFDYRNQNVWKFYFYFYFFLFYNCCCGWGRICKFRCRIWFVYDMFLEVWIVSVTNVKLQSLLVLLRFVDSLGKF